MSRRRTGFTDRRRVRAAARLLRELRGAAPAAERVAASATSPVAPAATLAPRPPDPADTLAAMEGDVHQTLGELERRLKELEQELESVGRAGEVGAEPAQGEGGWTPPPPPPPGTTPFTASWSGGAQQQPPSEPPTFNGAPAIPVRPPYWQPLGEAPAPAAAAGEAPASAATGAPAGSPSPAAAPAPAPEAASSWAAPAPSPAAAPAPPHAPGGASPEQPQPSAATAGLHRQLDELLAFRERLVASTNELVDELSRVLTDLGAEVEAVEEPPSEPDPADTVLSGQVAVEAGPFGDLATLAAFEQALQATDGVAAVHVRTLSDGHATIDVTLDEPTRLAAALRERAVVAFEVVEVDDHRLVLAVGDGQG